MGLTGVRRVAPFQEQPLLLISGAMGLGDFHKRARLPGLLALFGVLLYTGLVPGHVVSQAAALVHGGEPGLVAEMHCHDGMVAMGGEPAPDEPPVPQKKCPFCKGYAVFMAGLSGACDAGILDAERALPVFAVYDEHTAAQTIQRLHNRGPPIIL